MKFVAKVVQNFLMVSALLGSASAYAAVEVLDFDEFADGQIIDDEYLASLGVTISSVNYKGTENDTSDDIADRQVAFSTLNINSQDNDLEFANLKNSYTPLVIDGVNYSNFSSGQFNPGNILIIQENNNDCATGQCSLPDDEGARAAGYFNFDFNDPVTILSIDFFDIEDQVGQDLIYYTIYFYDSNDNLIQSELIPTMEDSEWARQAYNIAGVSRIQLNMPGSGGIDNLAYRTTEVSAPHTAAIFILGLSGLWLRARKKS